MEPAPPSSLTSGPTSFPTADYRLASSSLLGRVTQCNHTVGWWRSPTNPLSGLDGGHRLPSLRSGDLKPSFQFLSQPYPCAGLSEGFLNPLPWSSRRTNSLLTRALPRPRAGGFFQPGEFAPNPSIPLVPPALAEGPALVLVLAPAPPFCCAPGRPRRCSSGLPCFCGPLGVWWGGGVGVGGGGGLVTCGAVGSSFGVLAFAFRAPAGRSFPRSPSCGYISPRFCITTFAGALCPFSLDLCVRVKTAPAWPDELNAHFPAQAQDITPPLPGSRAYALSYCRTSPFFQKGLFLAHGGGPAVSGGEARPDVVPFFRRI